MAAASAQEANVGGAAGDPERVFAGLVTANTFEVLGIAPALGRGFRAGEDVAGRDQVVVLSDAIWRRRFAANPLIVGRPVLIDGRPVEVVGVMRPDVVLPSALGAGPRAGSDPAARPRPGRSAEPARRPLPGGVRTPGARGHGRVGVERDEHHPRSAHARVSRSAQPGPLRHRREAAARRSARAGAADSLDARWRRSGSCCCSPAPTSPTCSSRAAKPGGASWPCAERSARAGAGSPGSSSPKRWSCRSSGPRRESSSPCSVSAACCCSGRRPCRESIN